MRRMFIRVQVLLALLVCFPAFASASPIQQIYVSNMLWNQNATAAAQGLTPTAVVVAFHNGGASACFTTTLAFQGATTILVGTGQPCVAAVTTVSMTPVAGPAGTIYATPTAAAVPGANYSTQILIDNKTDPIFDTTNGKISTQGAVQATIQGS